MLEGGHGGRLCASSPKTLEGYRQGPKVVEFETALAAYLGTPRLLTCNAGTSALHLAYHMAIDHAKDAEVISTPITCTATNTPILNNGARIVWADVDPVTGSIDPADIERKITAKTRAIAVVHWGGNPCDLARINAIAAPRGITVIEDNAHGWGSSYRSRPIGNHRTSPLSLRSIKHGPGVGRLLAAGDQARHQRRRRPAGLPERGATTSDGKRSILRHRPRDQGRDRASRRYEPTCDVAPDQASQNPKHRRHRRPPR